MSLRREERKGDYRGEGREREKTRCSVNEHTYQTAEKSNLMGIAIRNGVALAGKMALVGFIPVIAASSQLDGPEGNMGIVLFWILVLAVLQGVVIMNQAKIVAEGVFRSHETSSE
ncbi:hypothetical protein [Halolamina sp. C58]|uniref:hypothetical protein n=1 Tax=Halolamina sp. C58 TaxID=3421640 RepID=UPI003EBA7AD4